MQQTTETKVWDKAAIHNLLEHSDRAVEQALLRIYARQTAAEQSAHQTIEHNGRGFTGTDAEFLSDLAKGIGVYGSLTVRQLPHARRKMKKYWRQLLEEVEAKSGAVSFKVSKKKAAPVVENEVSIMKGRSEQFGMF